MPTAFPQQFITQGCQRSRDIDSFLLKPTALSDLREALGPAAPVSNSDSSLT